jgi:hypothetical protein
MSKNSYRVQRAGAFVVKAAESPSSRVRPKSASSTRTPDARDKRLARAVLRHRTAG